MMYPIIQVYPRRDFSVYLYFADGNIKRFDALEILQGGGVFIPLMDPNTFVNTCTVINGTLAWDLSGKRDPYNVIDLDPENLYNTCETVKDPLASVA